MLRRRRLGFLLRRRRGHSRRGAARACCPSARVARLGVEVLCFQIALNSSFRRPLGQVGERQLA